MLLARSTSRIGMPEMALPVWPMTGAGDLVGADHEGHVGLRELRIDLLHLLQPG
jgi:hypothetical protein